MTPYLQPPEIKRNIVETGERFSYSYVIFILILKVDWVKNGAMNSYIALFNINFSQTLSLIDQAVQKTLMQTLFSQLSSLFA